jgi:predicted acylesterase/phospholipase RssA
VIGRRLTNSVNPEGEGRQHALPRIGDTLIQSMVLGSHHRISRIKALADVVIAPEVSGVPLLDFDRLDSLVAAGRTAAERALDANAQLFASSGA